LGELAKGPKKVRASTVKNLSIGDGNRYIEVFFKLGGLLGFVLLSE